MTESLPDIFEAFGIPIEISPGECLSLDSSSEDSATSQAACDSASPVPVYVVDPHNEEHTLSGRCAQEHSGAVRIPVNEMGVESHAHRTSPDASVGAPGHVHTGGVDMRVEMWTGPLLALLPPDILDCVLGHVAAHDPWGLVNAGCTNHAMYHAARAQLLDQGRQCAYMPHGTGIATLCRALHGPRLPVHMDASCCRYYSEALEALKHSIEKRSAADDVARSVAFAVFLARDGNGREWDSNSLCFTGVNVEVVDQGDTSQPEGVACVDPARLARGADASMLQGPFPGTSRRCHFRCSCRYERARREIDGSYDQWTWGTEYFYSFSMSVEVMLMVGLTSSCDAIAETVLPSVTSETDYWRVSHRAHVLGFQVEASDVPSRTGQWVD